VNFLSNDGMTTIAIIKKSGRARSPAVVGNYRLLTSGGGCLAFRATVLLENSLE